MLKLMRYSEAERRDAVIGAFKTIYLTTNTKNMSEHTTTIVKRLITLFKEIRYDNFDDFQNIVTEWTTKGVLDNSIIDKLWRYITKREEVADDDARAAVELLRMAAMGRNTIITKNISVVTTVAFSDHNKNNMLFLASCWRLLAVAGADKVDIQSKNPPFKIAHQDEVFTTMSDIIVNNFLEKIPFYHEAMEAAINFIFRVCSKPIEICEKILKRIYEKFISSDKCIFSIVRLCELLGCLAIKLLGYLDNNVYREFKRRKFLVEAQKENSKPKNKNNISRRNTMNNKTNDIDQTVNESILIGAQADDADAEFIAKLLDSYIVSNSGILGKFCPFLLHMCERPDLYNDLMLQQAATVALMRYMLVSSTFCQEHIRLLFTICEKTNYPEVKCTVVLHCADLMTRFPNIVEPWSSKIYAMLRDPLLIVRRSTFFALSNLILRDMIRAHSHISEMTACLIDTEDEISNMCRAFFSRLAQKENNLANVIPDIFSHLVKLESISEENLRYIFKYLFNLVDTSKRMENLVDRFCCKYTVDDNLKLNRNITYCLSLINYNDKALKKLHDNFSLYKHHVHDAEIYATLAQILAQCSKNTVGKTDLQPIITDIENCIASVFEVNEDGQPRKPPPLPKSTKKPRKASKKSHKSNDDSFSEPIKKKRPRRNRTKKSTESSDSD